MLCALFASILFASVVATASIEENRWESLWENPWANFPSAIIPDVCIFENVCHNFNYDKFLCFCNADTFEKGGVRFENVCNKTMCEARECVLIWPQNTTMCLHEANDLSSLFEVLKIINVTELVRKINDHSATNVVTWHDITQIVLIAMILYLCVKKQIFKRFCGRRGEDDRDAADTTTTTTTRGYHEDDVEAAGAIPLVQIKQKEALQKNNFFETNSRRFFIKKFK